MSSTQFDDHPPFEEEPEEHRGRNQPDTLCETIKRLGYAQNNQVRLYGGVFDLVSDPVSVGENFVFVDATGPEIRSSQARPHSTDHRTDDKNKTSRRVGEQPSPIIVAKSP
jgi:hypothetical protein